MSPSTPSTQTSRHHRYSNSSPYPSPFAAASPVAIPNAQQPVPPPLPPPTHLPEISAGHDPGWQWGNDESSFGRSAAIVNPGSSLLGGVRAVRYEKEHDVYAHNTYDEARRGSSISTVTFGQDQDMPEDCSLHSDEDSSLSRPSSNYRLQSERQLEQRTLEASSNTYDKQLLSRIGGPNTPKRQSVSYTGGLPEFALLSQTKHERRNLQQLKPLSLPERRHAPSNSVDSPASSRWASSSAVSPGFTGPWSEHGPSESRTSATHHGSLTLEDSASPRGSYDQFMYINENLMEDGPMSHLNIHDTSPSGSDDYQIKAGSKRRACSPPREGVGEDRNSISSASGLSEIYHRRSTQHLPNRTSPVSRFHPSYSSVSTASSFGPGHGSLGSSLGVASIPSGATSYGSGRLSPNAPLTAADHGHRLVTPYDSTKALSMNHQQALADSKQGGLQLSADNTTPSRHGSLSHVQGVYICECCPKKPKNFETQEELSSHESEKQYTCAYCPNRFKNKNEAERHQNSLHLRRHSWACAALAGPKAAFHSITNANDTDVCGYCGEEFSNPPQWDLRAKHLNHVHKFGECNQAKKFYRADHFRQHLKHSHAGTSGKWTNMLEAACMKDEPPLQEIIVNPGVAQAPPVLMVTIPRGGHGSLAEIPHNS